MMYLLPQYVYNLNTEAATGANSQFNYQWEKSSDNSNFVSDGSSGVNNSTGALTSTTWYRVKVSMFYVLRPNIAHR